MNFDLLARRIAAMALPLVLAACGGHVNDDDDVAESQLLTLEGTAATGAAIVGGAVDAKCASGIGHSTTLDNGGYRIQIAGGALPCLLRVTSGATELYSLAGGTGPSVHANITQFTQLIAADVIDGDPADAYERFDADKVTRDRLTMDAIDEGVRTVAEALAGVVDLAGVNPLTINFEVGDPFDQKLDAFQASMAAAQTTLSEVMDSVVNGGGAATSTILQPAASTCAGLRSGLYRALNPNESDPQWADHVFQFDVTTMTATFWDGSTTTLANEGNCTFSAGTGSLLLVSKSGLTLSRSTEGTQTEVSVILPEQSIPVSALAGTWNALAYERDTPSSALHPASHLFTLNAEGNFTEGNDCVGLQACVAWPVLPGSLTPNAQGGYTLIDDEGSSHRAYAFKTPDGSVSLFIMYSGNSGFVVATPQRTLALPAVGAVHRFWDFTFDSSGFAGPLFETVTTVTAVDPAAQHFTRQRESDGRIDGLTVNTPRAGLRHRAAGSSTTNTGNTVNFSEILVMPLASTGVAVYTSVGINQNFFGVSITQP